MDAMRMSLVAWFMQQISDEKTLDRVGPVKSLPSDESTPNAFEFTIKDDDFPKFAGTFRVTVERVSE